MSSGKDLDDVIKRTLEEDEREKKKRKADKGGGGPPKKGKTLQEIEDEEGGPIKESMVGVAQMKRAQNRKKGGKAGAEDDTEVPAEIDRYEEDLEVAEEDGIKFMPFSLKEEREVGHFDAEGNYVEERKGREDRDAWLESTEIVNDKVKQMIEERKKAEAEAAASSRAAPMTDRQIAQAKAELAGHMQPGETVTRLLKRIRGGAGAGGASGPSGGPEPGGSGRVLTKRDKLKMQQAERDKADKDGSAGGAPVAGAGAGVGGGSLELFNRLAEIVDHLFAEGETDMYTTTREELERSAAMWLPQARPAPAGAGAGAALGPAKPTAAAADDDDDDDMFGDEEPAAKPKAAAAPAAAAAAAPAAPAAPAAEGAGPSGAHPAAATAAPAAAGPRTDFSSWPIKELKRFLSENGVDASDIVEKGDLVSRATQVEEEQLAEAQAAAAAASSPAIPDGFIYDAQSGYYHNASSGLYYDASSWSYFDGTNWLRFDETSQQYVPIQQSA